MTGSYMGPSDVARDRPNRRMPGSAERLPRRERPRVVFPCAGPPVIAIVPAHFAVPTLRAFARVIAGTDRAKT